MFVDFFIRRPVFATVCSLLIILAGAIAIPTLSIAQFPVLAPPQVTVSANYTGANAQAVESGVTTLLEQAINGAEGMRYMSSSSGNDGSSSITATFRLDRSLDIAAVDVQNRASTAQGRLPASVQQTGVTINKNSGSFVLAYGVFSRDNRYDPLFISNYLDVYVRDALKRIPGVGDVIIFGERKYAMRLWLDPVRLAKRGLTAVDVTNALAEQNVQVAAGQIGQPPVAAGQLYTLSVRATGRLTDAKEFERLVVKQSKDGSIIQLRDVGRAELGAERLLIQPHVQRISGDRPRRRATIKRQRARRGKGRQRRDGAALQAVSCRLAVPGSIQHHYRRPRIYQRSAQDARCSDPDRHHCDLLLPADLAQHADSCSYHSCVADWGLCVRQTLQLFH